MAIENDNLQQPVDKSVSWDEVTNKPTRFAPLEHEHDILWNEVIGKPTEFTPEFHTHDEYAKRFHRHTIQDIIGFEGFRSGGDPNDHNHDNRYYNKAEVDGKLSLKADTNHIHDIRELTGLDEVLDCYKQFFVDKDRHILDDDQFYIYKVVHNLNTKALEVKVNNADFKELIADVTMVDDNVIEILTDVEEDLVVLIKKINLLNNTWRK